MFNIQHVFAIHLKQLRTEMNLTQAVLAKKIGTTGNYIAMIERELKFPSPAMIERIASALGVESTELFVKIELPFAHPWNWKVPKEDESAKN
jgi:transcriptional regulator with XRE-family HTH domain